MWTKDKQAPVWEFLGWTFLIMGISYAICIIGEMTGILSGSIGGVITSVIDTLIGAFSPLYATYIVLKRHNEITGIREFAKRILYTPNVKNTLIITLAFCLFLLIVAILAGERTDSAWYIIIPAVPLMVLGGGVEEVGWRGFLQPALEKKMPFVLAVLTTTSIWFVWHVPMWFLSSSNQSGYNLLPYALQLIVNAFALAAIYKVSRSTIACILYHAWGNAIGAIYKWEMFATYPISMALLVYDCVVIIVSIAVYTFATRKDIKMKQSKYNLHQ